MKERPILFSAPMVRAILDGRKTVTRRSCKPQPSANAHTTSADGNPMGAWWETGKDINRCPYGQPGDRLWVRETWSDVNLQGAPGIAYRADDDIRDLMEDETFLDNSGAFNYDDPRSKPYQFACWSEDLIAGTEGRWRPSIFMPRWVSRILLEVTAVRVERLQEISEEQALAEGIIPHVRGGWHWHPHDPGNVDDWHQFGFKSPAFAFQDLWIGTRGDWDTNPWVWVVEFKRVTQ